MASPRNSKALFIRLDRIGDLVLTLPVDQSLELDHVEWWIPQRLSFVTQLAKPQRRASEVSKQIGFGEFLRLLHEVKAASYDFAVVFHGPWWVGLLLWLARVPVRIGVKSQWHSFLFFNRGVRQKRSQAEHSELEYNFRLVEAGLGLRDGSLHRRSLFLDSMDDEVLSTFDLKKKDYVVVHPGMSGSARNWPTDRYHQLVTSFAKYDQVVITGTASDSIYVAPLKQSLAGVANVKFLDEKLTGRELVSVLGNAKLVFAPSTGVVHLAASTGVPTLGLYSPVRVQRAVRWGPQGPKTATLTPLVNCPGELACIRNACPHWDCMPRVTVTEAIETAAKL